MLISDVLYTAFRDAHILKRPGAGLLSAAEQSDGLVYLNRILDEWQAKFPYAYASTFQSFTLTPGHAPHLIGPGLVSPDFGVNVRPVRIDGGALILNTQTPNVDVPLNIRDKDWWNNQRVKALTTNVPTDLYYEADWPNGQLNFWPVPEFAYGVRLQTWVTLLQAASVTVAFSAPPAYFAGLSLTLAEALCQPFLNQEPPASLVERARKARLAIQGNNAQTPRIQTIDYGTRGRSKGGDFNYYTGGPA